METNTNLNIQRWHLRNDLEIRCNSGKCVKEDSFTPADVSVSDSGSISVGLYTTAWSGTGLVLKSKQFVVAIGHDLQPNNPGAGTRDIIVAVDTNDNVGIMKSGQFAQPLLIKEM